jgi:Lipopolysaccharide-assembly
MRRLSSGRSAAALRPSGRRSHLAQWLVAAGWLAALAAGGCGYSLRSSLPAHIKTVHVPVLVNRTQEPGIESLITQALADAVITSGPVLIVGNATQADAVLEGAIIEYSLTSLAFDRTANVTRYRLRIALALTLTDRVKNVVLWRQSRVEDRADFPVAGPVTRTLALENDALRRAAVDISRAIVSLAFEGF